MGFWQFFERYAPTAPRDVRAGIKAKSKRGAIGETPWAEAWRNVLERQDDPRLSRGRSYARRGQVFDLHLQSGLVEAHVQGSRPTPYKVKLAIRTLRESDWTVVFGILARNPLHAAKLLAGQPSMEMFDLFQKAGVGIIPLSNELTFSCNCPDWGAPCKHGAAVFYLICERLDKDPLLLFLLRGKEREAALLALQKSAHEEQIESAAFCEPLPVDPAMFWGGTGNAEMPTPPLILPDQGFCLLDSLGAFPFWQGEVEIVEALRPLYRACQEVGLHLSGVQEGTSGVEQDDTEEDIP